MLLLSVATDWELPVRPRAHLWLEIYGNALIQARTAAYISARRTLLQDVLCSARGPAPLPTLLDAYTLLKHRTRDEIDAVFKTWDESISYDITLYRDTRMRAHLGARYDSRDNAADWDYNTCVKAGAGVVHGKQYREWRRSGVAFEYGDARYEAPNRSLGSYAEGKARKRGSILARGFWGDTVVSPYHAVGTSAYIPTDEEASAAVSVGLANGTVGGACVFPLFCFLLTLLLRHFFRRSARHVLHDTRYAIRDTRYTKRLPPPNHTPCPCICRKLREQQQGESRRLPV